MKKVLHPAASCGTANFGWSKANYSFSFVHFFDAIRLQIGMSKKNNSYRSRIFTPKHLNTAIKNQSTIGIDMHAQNGTVIVADETLTNLRRSDFWETQKKPNCANVLSQQLFKISMY